MHYENCQRLINDEVLGIKDYRSSFFIKVYAEKLDLNNPFFLQSRLGTPFSVAKELDMYINSYDSHHNINYIEKGVEELCQVIKSDPVIKKILGSSWKYIEDVLSKNKNLKDSDSIVRINFVIGEILKKTNEYEVFILKELKRILFEERDLSKFKTIYSEIDLYTGLYISLLVDKGFSFTYLYNRLNYLVSKRNYKKGTNFEQQFDSVFNKLSFEKSEYEVFFKVYNIDNFEYIEEAFKKENWSLVKEVSDDILKKFPKNHFTGEYYIRISVLASDYLAATFTAKKIINKKLDLMLYTSKAHLDIYENCVVYYKFKALKHIYEVNVSKELEKLYVEESLYTSRNGIYNFSNVIDKLMHADQKQIQQSFRYMRLTRKTFSNEQKIINLWIALESLFYWKNGSKILTILTNYIPKFYSHLSINSRLDLALKFVHELEEKILEKDNKELDHKDLLDIFLNKNDDVAKKIYNLIESDIKKYRYSQIRETFIDVQSINKQIKNTEVDVERQLRRIYFLRNKISHTGFYADINPILSIHLMDYIQMCYSIIYKGLNEFNVLDEKKANFFDMFTINLMKYEETQLKSIENKNFQIGVINT